MNRNLRTDFENIADGTRVLLHPADANQVQREPVRASIEGIYFFCDGSDPLRGADYHLGEVAAFFRGYELLAVTA